MTGPASVGPGDPRYPTGLRDLADPPATLFVAGRVELVLGPPAPPGENGPGLTEPAATASASTAPASTASASTARAVAVVGARAASPYGLEVASALGRGLAAAGVIVVSGLAHGIDAAAHLGALEAGGDTIAVLAGGADRPHPPSARALHARIGATGAVVSERPPGTETRRWMFPARNRLIAALTAMTVVVEARTGSGALLTARAAHGLGRLLGAVPGRISSPLAAGPHQLIAAGAALIASPSDVLEALGRPERGPPGASSAPGTAPSPRPGGSLSGSPRPGGSPAGAPGLPDGHRALWRALAEGQPTEAALSRAGLAPDAGLAALAALELGGLIRRQPGGRWTVPAG